MQCTMLHVTSGHGNLTLGTAAPREIKSTWSAVICNMVHTVWEITAALKPHL